MGLNTNRIIRLVNEMIVIGAGKSICMLGLQCIHIEWDDFVNKAKRFDIRLQQDIYNDIKDKQPVDTYAFFRMLGFSEVHAIDISGYEGADILLDLNQECPDKYYEQFDVIIDGGTLEHVFNIPIALKNICNLLKPNGIVIHGNPLAGYIDHGFYSISPTLYLDFYLQNGYRILNSEIEFVMDIGKGDHARWNAVYSQDCRLFQKWGNTDSINEYVRMIGKNPNVGRMVLWTVAQKIKPDASIKYPIQSMWDDYEGWDEGRKN